MISSVVKSKPSDKPPADLLDAFRACEETEKLGALLTEEGFDAHAVHVLAAWMSSNHTWKTPRKPCPDNGKPTAAAWRWLVSGWTQDVEWVAQAADVSLTMARQKLEVLIGNRLIYPDGTVAKGARAMLQATIRKALGASKRKKEAKPQSQPPTDDDGGN